MLLLILSCGGIEVRAEAVRLPARDQLILVNLSGGLPGRWVSCVPNCVAPPSKPGVVAEPATFTSLRPASGGTRLSWVVPGDPEQSRLLDALEYEAELWRGPGGTGLILRSKEPFRGMRLVHRYLVPRAGRTLLATLQVPPGARLEMRAGSDLAEPRLPGLGAFLSEARAVTVGSRGQAALIGPGAVALPGRDLPAREWAGVRGRFWALLVQAESDLRLDAAPSAPEEPAFTLGSDSGTGTILGLRFYAGPVEATALAGAAPELRGMLYAPLWGWLRALAFGLASSLVQLQGLVGNYGLAILLLGFCVNLLMAPLSWAAGRLQALALRQGQPWYLPPGLAGILIQVPVYLAAFDMLGENFHLRGARFLWIPDLAMPDRAWPGALPLPGSYLNLLPVLLAVLTLLAFRLRGGARPPPARTGGPPFRAYALAAVLLALLYAFPAGIVLFGIATALFHILLGLARRPWGRGKPAA